MRTKIGRHKGSRNRGYFYRAGRGWHAKDRGQFVPLLDEAGERLRDTNIDERIVREAYARRTLAKPVQSVSESADDAVVAPTQPEPTSPSTRPSRDAATARD